MDGRLYPSYRSKQCGFSSAIRAEQTNKFAGSEREINSSRNDVVRSTWTGIPNREIP
jgi:hypothetical protein